MKALPAHRALLQPSASRPAALPSARSAALSSAHPECPAAQRASAPHCPSRPTLPSRATQAKSRRPAQAALLIPSCATPPPLPAPPSRPTITIAAAAAAAVAAATAADKLLLSPTLLLPCQVSLAAATGTTAGAGGAGGAAGSTGGVGGAARSAGGAATDCHCLPSGGGFGFMGTAQRRKQRPQGTFSLQWLHDCASQRCVPGCVEAASLGASESAAALGAHESGATLGASASTATGPASAEAFLTSTHDSGTSRCFLRDCTTLTPLAAPVPVSLADPTGGPVVARASTILLCSAVPSGSLSGLHLPAFLTKLLSNAVLQDVWVDIFIPGGQHVAICKCSRAGRHLATFTHQPGSSLYTLTTESTQVAASGQATASSQVSTSVQLAASCSCR
ncbi:unnamed protein product [Closterium sp. NIES-54]